MGYLKKKNYVERNNQLYVQFDRRNTNSQIYRLNREEIYAELVIQLDSQIRELNEQKKKFACKFWK